MSNLIEFIDKASGLLYDTVNPMPKVTISSYLVRAKIEAEKIQTENGRMKKLINSYGKNDFDFGVLGEIDKLEMENNRFRIINNDLGIELQQLQDKLDDMNIEVYESEQKAKDWWTISKIDRKIVRELIIRLNKAKAFEKAVRKRHNGYDPNNDSPEPETPEQALQDLEDGWDKTEEIYTKTIVELQNRLKTAKLACEDLRKQRHTLFKERNELQVRLDEK